MMALPDIKMLNEMAKTDIRAVHKLIDPPILLHDDGILGGGATTVNNCSRWGCTDMGWHLYWLGKIPNFSGRNGAVHHNWWAFVLDWDAARQ